MKNRGFTLIEIMIVVLIIGLLLSIAAPNFLKARSNAQQKGCLANLKQIDRAKEEFAMQNNLADGSAVNQADLWPTYIKGNAFPSCPGGGTYTINNIGTLPACSLAAATPPHMIP